LRYPFFVLGFGVLATFLACGGGDDAGGDPGGAASSSGASGSSSSGGGGGSSSGGSSSSSGNPSKGCGQAGAPTGFQANLGVTAAGANRTYSIAVPATYDPARRYPVVFAFHGDGGDGASARNAFKFETAHGGDAIFVYPNGTGKTWDLDTFAADKNKDVQLVQALVDSVKTQYCVDEAKVYAAGFSRGGFFANHVGCQLGGTVRAVASHGGGGPYGGNNDYDDNGNLKCPGQPIAALIVIGANDGLLPDSKSSRDFWRVKNTCKASTDPATPSPCVTHQGCAKPLEYCQIAGMGHQVWAEGSETTWSFFMAQ